MATASYDCWFNHAKHEARIVLSDRIHKEKSMNTYYISARTFGIAEYVVEAENEDAAIHDVEIGNVDPEMNELEYVEDIQVTDVEYGDVEYTGKLGVTIVVRGKIDECAVTDAAYQLLAQFDGKTTEYKGAELELIGFSVDHIEEA